MNREIKLRVWDKDLKKYLNSPCLAMTCDGSGFIGIERFDNSAPKYYPIFEKLTDGGFVAEQFTGQKDKNGKEIYEGDILKRLYLSLSGLKLVETGDYDFWAVKWNNAGFWNFAVNNTFETFMLFEVVGNIHENPELLK